MNQKIIWNKEYKLNANKWRKETKGLPKIFADKVILEIGVGNGKTLPSLIRQKPKEIYAIDYSFEAIDLCGKNEKYSSVKFNVMDAKNLDFDNNFFDAIVCNYVLNNMLKRERIVIANEIYRVVKSGGVIVFEDFLEGDFRQKLSEKYNEKNTIIKKNGIICHFFTKEEVLELFSNFKKIKLKTNERTAVRGKEDIKRKIINAVFKK